MEQVKAKTTKSKKRQYKGGAFYSQYLCNKNNNPINFDDIVVRDNTPDSARIDAGNLEFIGSIEDDARSTEGIYYFYDQVYEEQELEIKKIKDGSKLDLILTSVPNKYFAKKLINFGFKNHFYTEVTDTKPLKSMQYYFETKKKNIETQQLDETDILMAGRLVDVCFQMVLGAISLKSKQFYELNYTIDKFVYACYDSTLKVLHKTPETSTRATQKQVQINKKYIIENQTEKNEAKAIYGLCLSMLELIAPQYVKAYFSKESTIVKSLPEKLKAINCELSVNRFYVPEALITVIFGGIAGQYRTLEQLYEVIRSIRVPNYIQNQEYVRPLPKQPKPLTKTEQFLKAVELLVKTGKKTYEKTKEYAKDYVAKKIEEEREKEREFKKFLQQITPKQPQQQDELSGLLFDD